MEIAGNTVTVTRVPHEKEPGFTVSTFTEAIQKQTLAEYHRKYPSTHPEGAPPQTIQKFAAEKGYSDSYDHFRNFFDSVRSRKQPIEDSTFGFRAAGAALLANRSVEKGSIIHWDPVKMMLG